MRSPLPPLTVLTLTLAACGGGRASPPGLAYAMPDPASVTYLSGDTAHMDIDAGGERMQARIASAATLATDFSRGGDGVQVSMSVRDLDARLSNPAGPPASADESGIEGPLVFNLDRRGTATIVSQPKLNQNAQQFFQPVLLAQTFFPRLPGRGVAPGESWTDTIRAEGTQGEGSIASVSIVTYTAAGDTVIDGRSFLRITLEGTTDQNSSGLIAGMDFSQTASGSTSGWILWDVGRRLMVESHTDSEARGSMDVSAAPFPLGIRVRQQSRVKLQESR